MNGPSDTEIHDETDQLRARVAALEAELARERRRSRGGPGTPFFDALIETLYDGVTIAGEDGRSTFESGGFLRVLGHRPEEHVGRSVFDPFHPEDRPRAERLFADLLDDPGGTRADTFRLQHANGEYRVLEARAVNLLEDPDVGGVVTVYRDVTEARQTEAELREAHEHLDLAIETSQSLVWQRDLATGEVVCEGRRRLPNGFEIPERANREEYLRHVHPDDVAALRSASEAAVRAGSAFEFEHRAVYPGEDVVHLLTRGTVVRDGEGRPTTMVGVSLDITRRKQAEQALAEAGERLNLALQSASAGTWNWDPVRDVTVWDGFPHPLFGRSGTFEGSVADYLAAVHPEDRRRIRAAVEQALESARTFVEYYRVVWQDGSVHHIRDQGLVERAADGTVVRLSGVCWDVTDRKLAEDDLREALQRLTFHVENSPLAVVEWDAEMQVVRWSPRAEEMFGWTAEEMLARDWIAMGFVHEEDRDRVSAMAEELISGAHGYVTCHNRNHCRDGSVIHCEWHNSALRDEQGRLVSILSFAQDVTQRDLALAELERAKNDLETRVGERTRDLSRANDALTLEVIRRRHAQEQALESEMLLRSVLQAVPDTVFVADGRGRVRHVFSERFHGRPIPAASDGRHLADLLPADVAERALVTIAETVDGEQPRRIDYRLENVGGPAGGVESAYTAYVVPFGTDADRCALWAARDVTEREHAEEEIHRLNEQLAHVGRFITVGEMIAGVAHDLHQPLTAIAGFAGGCLRRLDRDTLTPDQQREALDEIRSAALRAGEIVKRIKEFTRKRAPEREPLDVNELLLDALQLAHVGLRDAGVSVETRFDPDLPDALGDRVPLVQVVHNLLVNAADALQDNPPDDRGIVLCTERCEDDRTRIRVSVLDNGPGVPEDDRERIFERFFTSKSSGMGLGLAISRSVVEAQGGRIRVEPNQPRGAAFRFTLCAVTSAIFAVHD